MANRVRVPALFAVQTVFLAWAIFGSLANARADGLAEEDGAGAALATQPSFVGPAARRQLSEPVRRENLGFCPLPCFGLFPNCCFGVCVNLLDNPLNCGTCGTICSILPITNPKPICCGGVCTNLLTDPKNCGICGKSCGKGKCVLGFCNYNGKF